MSHTVPAEQKIAVGVLLGSSPGIKAPVFRAVGPCKTWVPAASDHVADSLPPPEPVWQQGRRQQRWLVKNHPEASLGGQVLDDYLVEETASDSLQDERIHSTCYFSLGELTDVTLKRNTGVPIIVTVTGNANNILRLAMLDKEIWTWPQEPNVTVRLSEIAMETPALWLEDDVGPIHRVKCIVDLKPYNPTRWLAVQRDSGTTIFQPEYRKTPAHHGLAGDASHIAANPLFHLSREQTGGNVHSDVSFNPSTRSNSPQLAIIDERGVWSIWDVGHARPKAPNGPAPKLRKCGHIDTGVLEQLPSHDQSDVAWHKILWVGRSESGLNMLGSLGIDADNTESGSQAAFPSLQRSSLLLLCSPRHVRLLDVTFGVYLPDLVFCRHESLDRISDVQVAHDPQYFYVLSTSRLFIVRIYSRPGVEWDKPEKSWSILFSTPHFRSSFDRSLRLVITQPAKSGQAATLVFVYSSTNSWIDLFHVEFSPTNPDGVTCQAGVTWLGNLQGTALNSSMRALHINPIPITVKPTTSLTTTGHDLAEKRVIFYEIAALRSDMSLVTTLCVSSLSSSVRISIPSKKLAGQLKTRRRKTIASQGSSSNFVVDDDSATSEEELPNGVHRYLGAFYERIAGISTASGKEQLTRNANGGVFTYNPFEAAHESVENALTNGPMPMRTLLQVMPNFKEVSRRTSSAVEWEGEVRRLDEIHPSVVVRSLNLPHSHLYFSSSASSREVHSALLEITKSSLHHDDIHGVNKERMAAISEQTTYDLYLSLHGIGYQSPGSSQAQIALKEDTLPGSQAESLPSSPLRFESPASTEGSQRSQSGAAENEDPAMTLLRTYTGTGKFVPEKRLELLDKWQLDSKPSDYTFDLDRSGDADTSRHRKAKQTAREHRKRRRAETLLQLSQEPELPATQPLPDTRFFSSQPRGISSQRQVIHSDPLRMMSQPPSGTFGGLPNRKVKKRKGGF